MKKLFSLALVLFSLNSFGYSVVDSMYEHDYGINSIRMPASQSGNFCLISDDQKVFAKSCYSSLDLCTKRLEFWKDLPGAKNHSCVKI
jgi:hypothetical protein